MYAAHWQTDERRKHRVRVDVAQVIRAHGGYLRWKQVRMHITRKQLRDALAAGDVRRLEVGGYATGDLSRAAIVAARLKAVQSHRAAAAHWGFALPPGPDVDHVTIPRKARRSNLPNVVVHYRDLEEGDLRDAVTTPLQTVIDCVRDLCLRDALSVGDSALRSGLVDLEQLIGSARPLRGPGAARVRQRVRWLDPRAENAFESSCRAILIDGGITGFMPQVVVRDDDLFLGRADLGNVARRILIECESFAYHGDRLALRRDCRRYTEFEAAGWRVLRVTWEHVMFEPQWVLARVRDALALDTGPRSTAQRASTATTRRR